MKASNLLILKDDSRKELRGPTLRADDGIPPNPKRWHSNVGNLTEEENPDNFMIREKATIIKSLNEIFSFKQRSLKPYFYRSCPLEGKGLFSGIVHQAVAKLLER